jgi:hypothetical protein
MNGSWRTAMVFGFGYDTPWYAVVDLFFVTKEEKRFTLEEIQEKNEHTFDECQVGERW